MQILRFSCVCASCRTLLRMPSAAAAQGLLLGQVPDQAGAHAQQLHVQQLHVQQATSRPTAACHLPLMRRTATSCCCWMLLRSCTRLHLTMALSPQLLLPMVCTVMMCISYSNLHHTSVEDLCDKGRLSDTHTHTHSASLLYGLYRSECVWQLDCSLMNMLDAVGALCKAASHDDGD